MFVVSQGMAVMRKGSISDVPVMRQPVCSGTEVRIICVCSGTDVPISVHMHTIKVCILQTN